MKHPLDFVPTCRAHPSVITTKDAASDVHTLPTWSRLAGVGAGMSPSLTAFFGGGGGFIETIYFNNVSCHKISTEFWNKVPWTEGTHTGHNGIHYH